MTVEERFELLLAEENAALRAANLTALAEIQARKRLLLDDLHKRNLSPEMRDRIAQQARENLLLMQHLAQLLRAFASAGQPASYGEHGQPIRPALKTTRGRI